MCLHLGALNFGGQLAIWVQRGMKTQATDFTALQVPHNKALQSNLKRLRLLSAAERGRYGAYPMDLENGI